MSFIRQTDGRTDRQTGPFMRRTCVLGLNNELLTDRNRVFYETYVRAWVEQCAEAAGVVAGAGFLDEVRVAALMRRLVERPVAAATFLSNVKQVLSTAGVGPARRFFHYFPETTANIDMKFTVI